MHVVMQRRHEYWMHNYARHIEEIGGRDKFKVITIVRDPIERNISMYRQFTKFPMSEIMYYRHHWLGVDWINAEIEPFWGIEIPNGNFRAPYEIHEGKLLILRFENIEAYPQAIGEFLGIEGEMPPLPHHGANARPLKERMWFPKQYVDSLVNTWYTEYFYTDAERQGMREKWTAT
jgi:hypothetical protein